MVLEMNAVESLIGALDLADAVERRYAEAELIQMGNVALRAIVAAFPSATLRQQVVMLKVLGRIGDMEALPALKRALLDDQWLLRQAAVCALANFPVESVLPMIFHALYDTALLVRLEAMITLGKLGHASAVPTLLAHLHGTTSEVETYTLIEALGLCGDRTLIPTFEPYMHHDNPQVRQRALDAIARVTGMSR